MQYTLGEAAKAVGRSKAAISRAIKNHVISAEKQENGSYKIDASELHRVYPLVDAERSDQPLTVTRGSTLEIGSLKAQLEAANVRIADKDAVIDDLRQRLDREGEERRKLMAILTDQREQTIITPAALPSAETPRRSWWRWGKSE